MGVREACALLSRVVRMRVALPRRGLGLEFGRWALAGRGVTEAEAGG